MLKQAWRGDLPIKKVFWVFLFLPGVLLSLASMFIYLLAMSHFGDADKATDVSLLVLVPWLVFIITSLIRSKIKQGSSMFFTWSFIVLLIVMFIYVSIIAAFESGMKSI